MVIDSFARKLIDKIAAEKELSEELLRYGDIKADIETEEKSGFRRIRIIRQGEKVYFLNHFNGFLINCVEV